MIVDVGGELDPVTVPGLGLIEMPSISLWLPISFPKMQISGCCKKVA